VSGIGTFGYDGDGNRTSDPNYNSFTYDGENRLTQLGSPAALTNTYDGDGTRISRVVGTTTTHFVGDTYENQQSVTNGPWTPTVYYLFGGVPVAMKQGATLSYLHHDHLGSLVSATNANGTEIGSARYFPYGKQRPASTTGTNPSGLPSDRLFTGQTRDLGNDAYYFFKSRYDDATIGRFHIPDSVVLVAGNPQAPHQRPLAARQLARH
jgi:hypothetical protein